MEFQNNHKSAGNIQMTFKERIIEKMENEMKITFPATDRNEAFARTVTAAFLVPENPTLSELNDIKTAVSEAVTNAVIHGYHDKKGQVELSCRIKEGLLTVTVRDEGCGIPDVKKAMEAEYTSMEGERSGLGFTFMEVFMDRLFVESVPGKGTCVIMEKKLEGGK